MIECRLPDELEKTLILTTNSHHPDHRHRGFWIHWTGTYVEIKDNYADGRLPKVRVKTSERWMSDIDTVYFEGQKMPSYTWTELKKDHPYVMGIWRFTG
ncbi:MAG TPA: hypothetical protein ENG14_04280 [Thermodesulforhabdus norvegica]|uniref:Uncharacterized protein n=1 Tax=Thermodesulforhabdus norvegica TaxID=39841 RepID=A0A7C1B1M2_9BACT|nr:hypothetical protein [Thermodesulforhabdus norvegica]